MLTNRVLIIEDELFIAYDLADIAESLGCSEVLIASGEDEAVRVAMQAKPDLILSDHALRQGTGPGAITQICARYGEIPTLFITATPELCEDVPHIGILSKPFSDEVVRSIIRSHCSAPLPREPGQMTQPYRAAG